MNQPTFNQMFMNYLVNQEQKENKLNLDWKEYFYKFLEEHGEPVPWDGKLLFSDGWQYSSTDYQGPEYPPPEAIATLKGLKVSYWNLFCARLSEEIKSLESKIKMLLEWQEHKSLPLQQRVPYVSTTDDGFLVRKRGEPGDLDLSVLRHSLDDKRYRRDEGITELKKLGQIT